MPPQPHILMCPPDFYGIHYEINPWMDMTRQAEHAVAVGQWQALYQQITGAGVQVSLLQPVEGLPDLVFTANAAMIYRSSTDFSPSVRSTALSPSPSKADASSSAHGLKSVPRDNPLRCFAISPPPAARGRALQSALVYWRTASNSSMCRKTSASKGPAMRCSAAIRCTPDTACEAMRAGTKRLAACSVCASSRSSWSTRVLPSRHMLLSTARRRGHLVPAGVR